MQKVIIASQNPVKIEATRIGFERALKTTEFEFLGIKVQTDIPDQPITSKQTLDGAMKRAEGAKEAQPGADFWVGLEGGIEDTQGEMYAFAWIVTIARDGTIGRSKTTEFNIPDRVAELVRQGKELGEADDIVFGKTNSKQQSGGPGLLTKEATNRTELYSYAVIYSLIPYLNKELYD